MNVTFRRLVIGSALLVASVPAAAAADAGCASPTGPADPPAIAGGNAGLSAAQPGPAPAVAPIHCWTGQSGGAVLGARVVALGDLLITLNDAGEVVALQPDGSEVWRLALTDGGTGTLGGVTTDGERVFVGTPDGLVALDPVDGSEIWRVSIQTGLVAGSTGVEGPIAEGDTVYAVFNEGGVDESVVRAVVALDPATGSERWRHEVFANLPAGRVSADSTTVALWDGSGSVVALDPATGDERWLTSVEELGIAPDGFIAIADGWIVTSLSDGAVAALSADDGSIAWNIYTDSVFTSSTTVQDGVVIINGETALYAVDLATGERLWSAPVQDRESPFPYRPVPAISDGLVIIGSTDVNTNASLIAFEVATGAEAWRTTTEIFGAILSPIVTGGRVYADAVDVNQEGGLFAFGMAEGQ